MQPLLIPAQWVEDKLNLYKKLKDTAIKEVKTLDPGMEEDLTKAIDIHNLYARYKDCENLLKEMKEASITKP